MGVVFELDGLKLLGETEMSTGWECQNTTFCLGGGCC